MLLVPHRGDVSDKGALPGDYQKMLAIVRTAGGPVSVKDVGTALGLDGDVRGRLEPLRGKLAKPPAAAGCANWPTAGSPPARSRPGTSLVRQPAG